MTIQRLTNRFITGATRGTAMCMASAAVLATMAFDIAGGLPKPYEFREFRAGVSALMNGETSTPPLEPAFYPDRGARPAPVAPEARVERALVVVQETPASEPVQILGDAEGRVVEVVQPIEAPEALPEETDRLTAEEFYDPELTEFALEENFEDVEDDNF